MKTDELRECFLSFFEQKDHERHPSDSLVPSADPTLLFTSAGMNQFKEHFQQSGASDLSRATSCQKCFRTGDIEEVGNTPYHLTFFEMLGNFSFGDYFKGEAIQWGWEFVREELGLDEEALCVSVYEDDGEAFQIWNEKVGLPESKIYEFGESENFWPANAPSEGPNGPCGPCSEIHYDYGEQAGCGDPDCDPACCDRFSELYNLVFMEFERKEGGELDPLPQKNIDTGMGLERTAAILQKKDSVFETDLFLPLVEKAGELLDTTYDPDKNHAAKLNRIADHIRASVFLIGDGVVPSNEGRGYVERKLLRRAVDSGKELNQEEPMLWKLVDPVVDLMGSTYPKLHDVAEHARTLIRNEEESYLNTLETGKAKFREKVEELKHSEQDQLSGEEAFDLYETYGISGTQIEKLSDEYNVNVDWEGFEQALEEERKRAREQTEIEGDVFSENSKVSETLSTDKLPETSFVGYHTLDTETEILSVIPEDPAAEEASEGQDALVITRDTPFYAEGGGQVGDTGTIETDHGVFAVDDTQQQKQFHVHHGSVESGRIREGSVATLSVTGERRKQIETHHSCTHILNAILRDVLGSHVQQAGSLVAPDRLRFDFTHPEQLTEEELHHIEQRANRRIMNNHVVESEHTTIDEARERGALMFFGDQYGDVVRTVQIGDFSLELCGGTHLDTTGEASLFKIITETSVGSGTRRIEAVCGTSGIDTIINLSRRMDKLCDMLSTTPEDLPERIQNMQDEIQDLQKQLKKARQTSTGDLLQELEQNKQEQNGRQFVVEELDEVHGEQLRSLVDDLVNNRNLDAAFLAAREEDSVRFFLRVSDHLQNKGFSANDLISRAADIVDGGGGGREDFAQGGGSKPEQMEDALSLIQRELEGNEPST